jgi:hypothetical protein
VSNILLYETRYVTVTHGIFRVLANRSQALGPVREPPAQREQVTASQPWNPGIPSLADVSRSSRKANARLAARRRAIYRGSLISWKTDSLPSRRRPHPTVGLRR